MKLCSLASGSAGNATYIESGETRILIDNGLSVKELTRRMAEIGANPADLDGIVLSHSHGDHSSGIARLAKFLIKRGRAIPIYLQREAELDMDWYGLDNPPVRYFESGADFIIGGIQVKTITTPHDCPGGGVAFTLQDNYSKAGAATDLGFIPPALISRFRDCQAILIESNYDPSMLEACDRPADVKARICGRNGHLSNQQCLEYLSFELPAVRHLILGHISQETNTADMVWHGALEVFGRAHFERPEDYCSNDPLILAYQDRPTPLVEF